MANSNHIVPFIKAAEGGTSKNPNDSASAHPVPDGSGVHTNKGITWLAFSTKFGTGADAIARFYAMNDADWNAIYKPIYWDACLGDKINSQRIADIIVDWVWGSGKYHPEFDVQDILVHCFGDHISEDGNFGPATIAAVNAADEQKLWDDIVAKRDEFIKEIVANNPKDEGFYDGWERRLTNLVNYEVASKN